MATLFTDARSHIAARSKLYPIPTSVVRLTISLLVDEQLLHQSNSLLVTLVLQHVAECSITHQQNEPISLKPHKHGIKNYLYFLLINFIFDTILFLLVNEWNKRT